MNTSLHGRNSEQRTCYLLAPATRRLDDTSCRPRYHERLAGAILGRAPRTRCARAGAQAVPRCLYDATASLPPCATCRVLTAQQIPSSPSARPHCPRSRRRLRQQSPPQQQQQQHRRPHRARPPPPAARQEAPSQAPSSSRACAQIWRARRKRGRRSRRRSRSWRARWPRCSGRTARRGCRCRR